MTPVLPLLVAALAAAFTTATQSSAQVTTKFGNFGNPYTPWSLFDVTSEGPAPQGFNLRLSPHDPDRRSFLTGEFGGFFVSGGTHLPHSETAAQGSLQMTIRAGCGTCFNSVTISDNPYIDLTAPFDWLPLHLTPDGPIKSYASANYVASYTLKVTEVDGVPFNSAAPLSNIIVRPPFNFDLFGSSTATFGGIWVNTTISVDEIKRHFGISAGRNVTEIQLLYEAQSTMVTVYGDATVRVDGRIWPDLVALPEPTTASAIAAPRVVVKNSDRRAVVSWDAAIVGLADVEFSPDLSNWSTISTNNSTGGLEHSFGDATQGFYRLRSRWAPAARAPRCTAMVTVQGGVLPQDSALAGQVVKTFRIGRYEIDWGAWQKVRAWAVTHGYFQLDGVGEGVSFDHPVENVSGVHAAMWCNAKSEMEGMTPVYRANGEVYRTEQQGSPTVDGNANGYRLPTEAEWEWAARGGASSQGYIYSGSDDVNEVAWYRYNSSDPGTHGYEPRARAVGALAPNELGLYDMSGNVLEWTFDSPSIFKGRGGGYWDLPDALKVVGGWGWSGPEPGLRVACNTEP